MCEQGGYKTGSFNQNTTHNLMKAYKDTNYTIVVSCNIRPSVCAKTQSSFRVDGQNGKYSGDTYQSLHWYACGRIN